jgi:hypothetical protein
MTLREVMLGCYALGLPAGEFVDTLRRASPNGSGNRGKIVVSTIQRSVFLEIPFVAR